MDQLYIREAGRMVQAQAMDFSFWFVRTASEEEDRWVVGRNVDGGAGQFRCVQTL